MDAVSSITLRDDELVCVVGPTASQKTELAIRLCEAFGGEVISADSVQIYRQFDVGSGKPTDAEMQRARHHLVSVAEPTEPWDAARWARAASDAIAEVRSRGKHPIVCGGAYLWVRALVLGLADAPEASPEVRSRLQEEAQKLGREALHARLAQVDPVLAARLSPRDFVRVQRALEVFELTGKRLSDLHAEHKRQPPRFAARLVGVQWTPDALERRIAQRAEAWLRDGWIDEVRSLLAAGLRETRSMGSVGYKQVAECLDGQLKESDLLVAITRATKIFARRQRTWLRDEPVQWLEPL